MFQNSSPPGESYILAKTSLDVPLTRWLAADGQPRVTDDGRREDIDEAYRGSRGQCSG
jgi:hypothetical protein